MKLPRESFSWGGSDEVPVPLGTVEASSSCVVEGCNEAAPPSAWVADDPDTTARGDSVGRFRSLPRWALLLLTGAACVSAFAHGWVTGQQTECGAGHCGVQRTHQDLREEQ